MDRADGLALLQMLEDDEAVTQIGQEVRTWWKERYPQVPDAVIGFMKGQLTDWKTCPQGLPWNRRRRRQLESAKPLSCTSSLGTRASEAGLRGDHLGCGCKQR